MKKFVFILIFLSLNLMFPNLTWYKEVSLSEMIDHSDLIVRAQTASPFLSTNTIRYWCNLKRYSFTMVSKHFQVDAIIYQKNPHDPAPTNKQILSLIDPAQQTDLAVEKIYNCEKRAKSPIIESYHDAPPLMSGNSYLLFLSHRNERPYTLVCHQAYVSSHTLPEILKILQAKKKGSD